MGEGEQNKEEPTRVFWGLSPEGDVESGAIFDDWDEMVAELKRCMERDDEEIVYTVEKMIMTQSEFDALPDNEE
jgi:hypothetical protein